MATNVTEKDKILREVIAWCDQEMKAEYEMLQFCTLKYDTDGEAWHDGRATAYQNVVEHCESLLGYTGTSMPLEVPNQSEDARQETGNA